MLFALEPLLLERLRERMTTARAVLSAADLSGVSAAAQVTPAVHVIFTGYRLVEMREDGVVARIEQDWLTVAVARNVSPGGQAAAAQREDAGAIADELIAVLMGWRPSPDLRELRLANAPRAAYQDGVCYLPIGWTTSQVVRGE